MGLKTTPATLATGNFITAAIWNTEVRDNLNALAAGQSPTFAVGNTGLVATGTTILTFNIPSLTYATTVTLQAEGVAGFAASTTVGLGITGTSTVTTRTDQLVQAAAAQWATVTRAGTMPVPANTGATISVVGESTTTAYYRASATLFRT